MKHKIQLIKEWSTTFGSLRLSVYQDGTFMKSFEESEMSEAMHYMANLESQLKDVPEVLHTIEI